MAIVWNGLALLFFVSLFMVSASVFTPRTALFFKEKTKLRGAMLWLSVALVCAVLVNELGPGFVPPDENSTKEIAEQNDSKPAGLPGYSFRIVEKQPGEYLAIDCALAAPVDENLLAQLAHKVFSTNQGGSFKEVSIRWFVKDTDKDPWSITVFKNGNWSIRIN